jgi:RNA polymerase sigma-70 factor (ECF subfamily)
MTSEESSGACNDLEQFRSYLRLLARMQMPNLIRSRVDESDIVQLTLLYAHKAEEDFRGSTNAEKAAWLRQILARILSHALRDNRRQKRDVTRERSIEASIHSSSARLQDWLAKNESSPSEKAIFNERVLQLSKALEQLPEAQRQAVELHYWQGLKLAEVAKKLDRTTAAVAGLLHRGLKALRKHLAD